MANTFDEIIEFAKQEKFRIDTSNPKNLDEYFYGSVLLVLQQNLVKIYNSFFVSNGNYPNAFYTILGKSLRVYEDDGRLYFQWIKTGDIRETLLTVSFDSGKAIVSDTGNELTHEDLEKVVLSLF